MEADRWKQRLPHTCQKVTHLMSLHRRFKAARTFLANKYPGVIVCAVGGICAEAISRHYGAPAMLIAVLIGLAIHFIYDLKKAQPGVDWTSRSVLRFGVALLGLRIALSDVLSIGLTPLLLVLAAMAVTMLTAALGARALGLTREFAALSGTSVAVCGASAAAAVASVLPQNKETERQMAMVVAVVTLLATVAMIFYPLLVSALELTPKDMGVVLGGTIHDVAQVVAAGNAISDRIGELATFVKLTRVSILLPIVMGVYFWLGRSAARQEGAKVRYLPGFLIAFFLFAAANSSNLVPPTVNAWASTISHYFLVVAITAIGVKTDLKSVMHVGWRPVALIVLETVVLLAVVLGGVLAMR